MQGYRRQRLDKDFRITKEHCAPVPEDEGLSIPLSIPQVVVRRRATHGGQLGGWGLGQCEEGIFQEFLEGQPSRRSHPQEGGCIDVRGHGGW